MMILIGQVFLWIFDYYIYDIVTLIKAFAAMGLAFGILYFSYLQRLDMVISSLGLWMFGNGLYIVAATAMNEFYYKLDRGIGTAFLTIEGAKNAYSDGLFMLAVTGMLATMLAGALTWKGVSFAASFFGMRITKRAVR